MGRALKDIGVPREHLVIATKVFRAGPGENTAMEGRKHILEGTKNSLERLGLDYVDIIYAHRPDYDTPVEETCRAMNWVIENNRALYWGTSEWPADRLARAIEYCERFGLHKPIVEQPEYSMLHRDRVEKEYRRLFSEYGLGSCIWSPLAGGLLTGKYNSGEIPEGSRYSNRTSHPFVDNNAQRFLFDERERWLKTFQGLEALAKENGLKMSQFCLAWALANSDITTALLGYTRNEQLDENIKALEFSKHWNKDLEQKVEDLLQNQPNPDINWRYFQPLPMRRDETI